MLDYSANIFGLTSTIASTATLILVFIITRNYQKKIDLDRMSEEKIFSERLGIYPELVQVISVSRKAASELVKNKKSYEERNLVAAATHLTDSMYKYRIFIPKEEYDELHRYKHKLQDFILYLDVLTRPKNTVEDLEMDNNVCNVIAEQQAQVALEELYNEIDAIHTRLVDSLQTKLVKF